MFPTTTAKDAYDGVMLVTITPTSMATVKVGSQKVVYASHDLAGVFGSNGRQYMK